MTKSWEDTDESAALTCPGLYRRVWIYQRDQKIEMTIMGVFSHGRFRELLFGSKTVNMLAGSMVPLLLLR